MTKKWVKMTVKLYKFFSYFADMIKLSGYKIIKKIGSGGMGDVYLAENEVLETTVAIKSLHANLVTDESFKKRFRTEAKVHAKLDHPNVVKLIDFQERKDGLFIIMEYVAGKQLDDYIKNVSGPIPEKELIPLFTQIVDAISHAHSKGLVHRDIKPANVIISKGKIKVLDFGIAKELSAESGLTKTGVQVGTPMYMSPEQVNGEKIDKLTDIYSLGVTLFYMAVGKPPYENSNAIKMGIKIISEPFPTAKEFYPGISNKIETIIKKATQKKKTDRYQRCEEFKKDLNSKDIISPERYKYKPDLERDIPASKESFGGYILKRKMNLIISFLLIPILKILVHYSLYAERYPLEEVTRTTFRRTTFRRTTFRGQYNENSTSSPDFSEIPGARKPIEDHVELIFDVDGKLEIFIPLFIIYIFVWLLNYKIWRRRS